MKEGINQSINQSMHELMNKKNRTMSMGFEPAQTKTYALLTRPAVHRCIHVYINIPGLQMLKLKKNTKG
jgi:hypothetical protein